MLPVSAKLSSPGVIHLGKRLRLPAQFRGGPLSALSQKVSKSFPVGDFVEELRDEAPGTDLVEGQSVSFSVINFSWKQSASQGIMAIRS